MERRVIKLAGVQIKLRDSLEDSIKVAEDLIRRYAVDSDIICLPEMWFHSNPYSCIDSILDSVDVVISTFRDLARDLSVAIVPGAIYEDRNGDYYITSYLIGPDGRVLGKQDKVHLFRNEIEIFKPGDDFLTFEVCGAKVGIMVCYDVAFPESARCLALKGAEVLLNPSRVVSEAIEPWHLYVKARCLENRVPILAVNVFDVYHPGRSIIVFPKKRPKDFFYPEVIIDAGEHECVIISEVDLEYPSEGRRDRFLRRVPEAYRCMLERKI